MPKGCESLSVVRCPHIIPPISCGSTRPTFSGLTKLDRLTSRQTEHIPSMRHFLRQMYKNAQLCTRYVNVIHIVASSPASKVMRLEFHFWDNCAASSLWAACFRCAPFKYCSRGRYLTNVGQNQNMHCSLSWLPGTSQNVFILVGLFLSIKIVEPT